MFILWFKNEDLHILVFHSARLKSFGPRDASEEEVFSRNSDTGEQREAKRWAKKWKRDRGGGEGFIAAFPSALKYVKAWPEANLHIKIL